MKVRVRSHRHEHASDCSAWQPNSQEDHARRALTMPQLSRSKPSADPAYFAAPTGLVSVTSNKASSHATIPAAGLLLDPSRRHHRVLSVYILTNVSYSQHRFQQCTM